MKRFSIALFGILALSSCGTGPWSVSNSTDRSAMVEQIQLDLTNNDCADAITLASQIYNSSYSDNSTRMLYASAQACNAGIVLFDVLNNLTSASFTGEDTIIRAFVRLFPSTSSDSRLASSWYAQDALQAMITPGAVIAPSDEISADVNNPGSDRITDRTLDSSSYLVFTSMAVIGVTLNRYGYANGQSPAALSYGKGQSLTWTSKALVQADTTGSACALASGFLNLFDSITSVISYLSGSTSSQLQTILTDLESAVTLVGITQCTLDGYSSTECSAAAQRLRYRGACSEQAAAASYTAGIIQGINAGWL